MLNFEEVQLSMVGEYKRRLALARVGTADTCFAYLYAMRNVYQAKIADFNGYFKVIGEFDGNALCSVPIGDMDDESAFRRAIEAVADYNKDNPDWRFTYASIEQAEAVERALPGAFERIEIEDAEDFVYDGESLRTYSGKKLHSKRNHVNWFTRTYNYSVEFINEENLEDCLDLNVQWLNENEARVNRSMEYEHNAVEIMLRNFDRLTLMGVLLRVDGKPVGFSFGEACWPGSDMLLVHAEKALYEYGGIYSMLCNQFVKSFPQFSLINREDAAGDEGLRRSKNSYRPIELKSKYWLVPREGAFTKEGS
ncbi:MAG: DUF2156 domain-containing protein [Christensenellales bacterium]|jgi:hypothetical protein